MFLFSSLRCLQKDTEVAQPATDAPRDGRLSESSRINKKFSYREALIDTKAKEVDISDSVTDKKRTHWHKDKVVQLLKENPLGELEQSESSRITFHFKETLVVKQAKRCDVPDTRKKKKKPQGEEAVRFFKENPSWGGCPSLKDFAPAAKGYQNENRHLERKLSKSSRVSKNYFDRRLVGRKAEEFDSPDTVENAYVLFLVLSYVLYCCCRFPVGRSTISVRGGLDFQNDIPGREEVVQLLKEFVESVTGAPGGGHPCPKNFDARVKDYGNFDFFAVEWGQSESSSISNKYCCRKALIVKNGEERDVSAIYKTKTYPYKEGVVQFVKDFMQSLMGSPCGCHPSPKNVAASVKGYDDFESFVLEWRQPEQSESCSICDQYPCRYHFSHMGKRAEERNISDIEKKSNIGPYMCGLISWSKLSRTLDFNFFGGPDTAIRSQGEKNLFVCLKSRTCSKSSLYSIWSVPVEGLLVYSPMQPEPLKFLCSWVCKKESPGRGFSQIGTRLYIFGGQKPCKYSSGFDGCVHSSRELFCFDMGKIANPTFSAAPLSTFSALSSMRSGKSNPIAVEMGGKLYVLAGIPYSDHVPTPCFEVYDPFADTWSPLDSPPLLNPSSKYFVGETYSCLSYVVIGNKLCVPSREGSCAYDVVEGKWGVCELFDGFIRNDIGSGPADVIELGSPFDFIGKGILYDWDILMCPGLPPVQVTAYQMSGGRVVKRQDLLREECSFVHLAELGGGHFCCLEETQPPDVHYRVLSLLTFRVSKLGGVGNSDPDFLKCEVLNKQYQRVPLGSFVDPVFSFTM